MAAKALPSAEHLRALFRYERRSGRLYWRRRATAPPGWNARFAGRAAGTRTVWGVAVSLSGHKIVLAHRVIWKMVHAAEADEVDHIDGNPLNNRIENLRNATRTQNMRNTRRRPGASGLRGVSRRGRRWSAGIFVDGRKIWLGTYDTPSQAHAAYRQAARQHFGPRAPLE